MIENIRNLMVSKHPGQGGHYGYSHLIRRVERNAEVPRLGELSFRSLLPTGCAANSLVLLP